MLEYLESVTNRSIMSVKHVPRCNFEQLMKITTPLREGTPPSVAVLAELREAIFKPIFEHGFIVISGLSDGTAYCSPSLLTVH